MICLQGGLAQSIFCDEPALPVVVIDWDVAHGDLHDERIRVVSAVHRGRLVCAHVTQPMVQQKAQLAGSDIEAILQAAESTDDT